MEILAVIGVMILVCVLNKTQTKKIDNYCNRKEINYKKLNEDRIMNDLSSSQINQNILNGKYDTGKLL